MKQNQNKSNEKIPESKYSELYLSVATKKYFLGSPCYNANKMRNPGETGELHCIGQNKCKQCSTGLETI